MGYVRFLPEGRLDSVNEIARTMAGYRIAKGLVETKAAFQQGIKWDL